MVKYVLEILDGDRAGDILPVTDKPLRIGRKPVNDLVLGDEKTSGVHCEVTLEGDRHVLRDLGSTNGTWLDGKRIHELVLTAGDVIAVGRLRVRFRAEEDGTIASGPDFAVHRLDASRVRRRGGVWLLVAALLVVGAGGGGFYWYRLRPNGAERGAATRRDRPPLAVPGNKIPADLAGCESSEGWVLDARGVPFAPSGEGHTGAASFVATRGAGGEVASSDFALAHLEAPIPVLSERSLVVAAWVRTTGRAKVAIRAVGSSSDAGEALRFRHGTPLASPSEWTRIEVAFAVPAGFDRLDLELVAVLPDEEAEAYVDDVSVTEGGAAKVLDRQLTKSGQRVLATGGALALRSTDLILLGVGPGEFPGEFASLEREGLLALSDVGAELAVEPGERSLRVSVSGVDAVDFRFPADSGSRALARSAADGDFRSVAAGSENTLTDLLLGHGATRVMLHFAQPVLCRGRVAGGILHLVAASGEAELVCGFRAERREAFDRLRRAREEDRAGRPGQALALLDEIQRRVPQDSEALGEALQLRAEILSRLDDTVARLEHELGEARFFDTRGGFERVLRGVDRLTADYGAEVLAGRQAVAALREAASTRLEELDRAEQEASRRRLEELGKAFDEAGEPKLAQWIDSYIANHLGK